MITRRQFDEYRHHLDRTAPNRARAVVELLRVAETPEIPNRAEKRKRKPKRMGSPTRTTARSRRQHWHNPDPQEAEIRELNRLMRKELQQAPVQDGEVTGPLAVVARYSVPHLLVDFSLDPAEHQYPLEHWLMAKFGDVLREPDVEGYLAWRERVIS